MRPKIWTKEKEGRAYVGFVHDRTAPSMYGSRNCRFVGELHKVAMNALKQRLPTSHGETKGEESLGRDLVDRPEAYGLLVWTGGGTEKTSTVLRL